MWRALMLLSLTATSLARRANPRPNGYTPGLGRRYTHSGGHRSANSTRSGC